MRYVIKVGTNVLADEQGVVQAAAIGKVARAVSQIWAAGHEAILVSSGAIGMGKTTLPDLNTAAKKPTWAAIGQARLIKTYIDLFTEQQIIGAQCLLIRDDFSNRERYNNAVRTIQGLLAARCLPIINENDAVVTEDLAFGDNDVLASMLAIALEADEFIILTNQQGLYTGDPEMDKTAEFIPVVDNVDRELEKMCTTNTSPLGRGGMISKLRAAKHAVYAGIEVVIASGKDETVLSDLLSKETLGTRFVAKTIERMDNQKRWILSTKGFGQLTIDMGARAALGRGKSLLFPGILRIKGVFDKNEVVEIVDTDGATIGYGRVNYDSKTLHQAIVAKKQRSESPSMDKEVIHRNYMVVV